MKAGLALEIALSLGVAMPLEYTCVAGSIQRLYSSLSSSVEAILKCMGYTYSVITYGIESNTVGKKKRRGGGKYSKSRAGIGRVGKTSFV